MDKKVILSAYIGMFLLSTGLSYWLFDTFIPVNKSIASPNGQGQPVTTLTPGKDGVLDVEGPKTEACPLNGALYTKADKDLWLTRRPLAVMIENHADSRPQSGLQDANIVYEAVAEGGITRFMALYYCGSVKTASGKYDVGPVRSARTYFLDLASEYADYPLYAHVGGANCSAPKDASGRSGACTTDKRAQAIEQIQSYGWNNKGTASDLSQFSLSYKVCRREPERTGEVKDTEHTMYCSTKALWDVAADRGLTNQTVISKTSWDKNFRSWQFTQKDARVSDLATSGLAFDFWGDKAYSVRWVYDSANNVYTRQNGGQPHLDHNTQKAITAKNLVIQFVKESRSVDEHAHNLYGVIGTGKGVLIQNGSRYDITWSKASRTARTIFKDASGKEVNFVPGNIWVELLPLNTLVNYES